MRDVLPEAFELVERELISPENFRAFVFENPTSLWSDANPDFFAGTPLESWVSPARSQSPPTPLDRPQS